MLYSDRLLAQYDVCHLREQDTSGAHARSGDAIAIGQTRVQMALALVDPVPYLLVAIVVAWAALQSADAAFYSHQPVVER